MVKGTKHTDVTKRELTKIAKDRKSIWSEVRESINLDALEIRYQTGVAPCVHAIEAYGLDFPCPFGVVWWRWGMGTLEVDILNSFTHPELCRLGIRSHIQKALIKWLKPKIIVTGRESTDAGIAWMMDNGYQLNKARGVWFYQVNEVEYL